MKERLRAQDQDVSASDRVNRSGGPRLLLCVTALGALALAQAVAVAEQDRASASEKGSLVIYPNVEVRWSNVPPYPVIQDTFLHLTNDYPGAVDVKMYFVNGDPPIFVNQQSQWEGDPRVDAPVIDPWAPERRDSIIEPGTYSRTPDGALQLQLPGEHGIAVSIGLTSPACELSEAEGTLSATYNDSFGDTTEIRDAFVTFQAAGGDVRVPSSGHLEIVAVTGNTTALVGGSLPVRIGPAGSTLSGLPGIAEDGEVTFRITGYQVTEDDPDPLRVLGTIEWNDLCDDPNTAGCDSDILQTIVAANKRIVHPRIALEKTIIDVSACNDSMERDVTYVYTVTNPGNRPLDVTLTDDVPCGNPTFISGDDNPANGLLDEAETWIYQCMATVPGGSSTMAMVTGESAQVSACTATAEADVMVPICMDVEERDHPGWNWFDNLITLTANEPSYWSAATGLPKGVGRWSILDPGPNGPGRPDPDDPSQRYLRGFVVAFAVQQVPDGDEIRWNHLAGDATIVNYGEENAWQYNAQAFQVVQTDNQQGPVQHGDPTGTPGDLFLDGIEYAPPGQVLLMNFIASNSDAYSGAGFPLTHDTRLTLLPLYGDFRQETVGPRTTKAAFDIWNENEVKFTNLDQCVTCWSSVLVSRYAIPNHFLLSALHTDAGKARIDGLTSALCAPDDARATPLVGVAAKLLTPGFVTGQNLFDLGTEDGLIRYDPADPPPESRWDPADLLRK